MDVNTAAYRVVQLATGQIARKSEQKVRAGTLGALARTKALSKAERRKIAAKANKARWKKSISKGK